MKQKNVFFHTFNRHVQNKYFKENTYQTRKKEDNHHTTLRIRLHVERPLAMLR